MINLKLMSGVGWLVRLVCGLMVHLVLFVFSKQQHQGSNLLVHTHTHIKLITFFPSVWAGICNYWGLKMYTL